MKDYGVFSQPEFDSLIVAALQGKPCTDKQLFKLYKWASDTMIRYAILQKVLSGTVAIRIGKGGEPIFDHDVIPQAAP